MKMNNKGQVLVLFVIFIPLIIMLGAFLVDLSNTKYELNKLNNINRESIKYGLINIDNDPKEKILKYIEKNETNIDNCVINVDSSDKQISVLIEKRSKSIFSKVLNKNDYKEKSFYIGKIIDNKIVIERKK